MPGGVYQNREGRDKRASSCSAVRGSQLQSSNFELRPSGPKFEVRSSVNTGDGLRTTGILGKMFWSCMPWRVCGENSVLRS